MAAVHPTFILGNRIEATLWIAIAVVMCIVALRRPQVRRDCIVAAVAFALFGVSDLIETTTGAWWRPWWLLAWKCACLLAMLWLLARYVTRRRAGGGSTSPSRRSPRG